MPNLVSSAVSGSKVAPKAPARRRAAPPPPRRPPPPSIEEEAPAPAIDAVESNADAPPSPPPTQQQDAVLAITSVEANAASAPPSPSLTQQQQPEPTPTSGTRSDLLTEPVSGSTATGLEVRQQTEATLEPQREPSNASRGDHVTDDAQQDALISNTTDQSSATEPITAPADESESNAAPTPKKARPSGRKRQHHEEAAPKPVKRVKRISAPSGAVPEPTKRVKRSSARSNAAVQEQANEGASGDSTAPERASATSTQTPDSQPPAANEDTHSLRKTPKAPPKRKAAPRKTAKSAAIVPADADDEVQATGLEGVESAAEPEPTASKGARTAKPKKPAATKKAPRSKKTATTNSTQASDDDAQRNLTNTIEQAEATSDTPATIEASVPTKSTRAKKPSAKKTAAERSTVEEATVERPTTTKKAAAAKTTAKVKKRAPRKVKAPVVPPQEDEQERDDASVQEGEEEDGSGLSESEAHEIDPTKLSMFELSHDTRHGKVSEREKKMREINWTEVAQKRREAIERIIAGEQEKEGEQEKDRAGDVVETTETANGTPKSPRDRVEGSEQPEGDTEDQDNEAEEETADLGTSGGPSFRLVNGQIVVDEATLTIDRVAEAQAEMDNDAPVEEENDLTVRLNRATWVNDRRRDPTERVPMWRGKSDPWTEDETDRFYEALRMFGTDFFIISKMFAPKTRRQIKLKFVREEKLDPVRINAALIGTSSKTMDLDHYAKESGRDVSVFTKFENFKQAEQVIAESMKEKEAAMQEAIEEEAENARQAEIAVQQREKQKKAAEKKRKEKAAAKKRNKGMGQGTMGGAPDAEEGAAVEAEAA